MQVVIKGTGILRFSGLSSSTHFIRVLLYFFHCFYVFLLLPGIVALFYHSLFPSFLHFLHVLRIIWVWCNPLSKFQDVHSSPPETTRPPWPDMLKSSVLFSAVTEHGCRRDEPPGTHVETKRKVDRDLIAFTKKSNHKSTHKWTSGGGPSTVRFWVLLGGLRSLGLFTYTHWSALRPFGGLKRTRCENPLNVAEHSKKQVPVNP